MSTTPLPRHLAVPLLASLACAFAGNHVAARIAFDDGAGVLLAILCRSGVTVLLLASVVLWQRQSLRLPAGAGRWQLLAGLLIALQSLCLYSAVARIPVALALLVSNTAPIMLVLLTWALGGHRPTRRALALMGLILLGMLFALDVPARLEGAADDDTQWGLGIALTLVGALSFACALWITENRLGRLDGAVRSLLTMLVVFLAMGLVSLGDLLPGGLAHPASDTGWRALAVVALLYSGSFSILFTCMPRLDITRNAPVMNAEPVATLALGWVILGQTLSPLQMLGGLVVVSGIVLLSYRRAGRS